MVDDSIIRANVVIRIVYILKKSGATEIHFRSASPPTRYGCWYGIDTNRIEDELIAKKTESIAEIKRLIDERIVLEYGCNYSLDSLDYISLEGMEQVWRNAGITEGLCNACWTGKYPVK